MFSQFVARPGISNHNRFLVMLTDLDAITHPDQGSWLPLVLSLALSLALILTLTVGLGLTLTLTLTPNDITNPD